MAANGQQSAFKRGSRCLRTRSKNNGHRPTEMQHPEAISSPMALALKRVNRLMTNATDNSILRHFWNECASYCSLAVSQPQSEDDESILFRNCTYIHIHTQVAKEVALLFCSILVAIILGTGNGTGTGGCLVVDGIFL
jgi:hypothetical protein